MTQYIGWLNSASFAIADSLELCRSNMDKAIPGIIERREYLNDYSPLKLRITKGAKQQLVYEWTVRISRQNP